MKSNAVVSKKRIGWGLLTLSAMVVLFVTGTSFADEFKVYSWVKSGKTAENKSGWKQEAQKEASDRQIRESSRLLHTELALGSTGDGGVKNVENWVKLFTQSSERTNRRNEFMAMGETLITTVKDIFKKHASTGDEQVELAKADVNKIKLMFAGVAADRDEKVFGTHSEKDGDKFKKVSNVSGVKKLVEAILEMFENDPKAFDGKDIQEILKSVLDEETMKALGLSDKLDEAVKPEPTESPEPTATPEPSPSPAAAAPAQPATPAAAAATERTPIACPVKPPQDNVSPFLDELVRSLLNQPNNKPQIDPALAALADKVAPDNAREATPPASNATPFLPGQSPAPTPAASTDALRPDQQQESAPVNLGQLPVLQTATNGRLEMKKPTDDGSAEVSNLAGDINLANSKKKNINAEISKIENNPSSFVQMDKNGRPVVPNQYGFWNALGKMTEQAVKARAYANRLAQSAASAVAKVAFLKAEKKKLDPELALSEQEKEKEAALEQQIKDADNFMKSAGERIGNLVGAARDSAEQQMGRVQQFVTQAKTELEKQKKNRAAANKYQNEVVIAGIDQNIADLEKNAKLAQAEADEWEGIASSAEGKVSQANGSLSMAMNPTGGSSGGIRNAEKLAGVGQQRRVPGIGAAQSAASNSIVGDVQRGKLGATSNQGGRI